MLNDRAKLSIETLSAKSSKAARFIQVKRGLPSRTRSAARLCQPSQLLPRHRQVQSFLRSDEVIVVVLAQIDLHPVDFPVEYARIAGVV
jgi:hypothetical protein